MRFSDQGETPCGSNFWLTTLAPALLLCSYVNSASYDEPTVALYLCLIQYNPTLLPTVHTRGASMGENKDCWHQLLSAAKGKKSVLLGVPIAANEDCWHQLLPAAPWVYASPTRPTYNGCVCGSGSVCGEDD